MLGFGRQQGKPWNAVGECLNGQLDHGRQPSRIAYHSRLESTAVMHFGGAGKGIKIIESVVKNFVILKKELDGTRKSGTSWCRGSSVLGAPHLPRVRCD